MKEQFALYDRVKSFVLMLFLAVFAIAYGFILGAAGFILGAAGFILGAAVAFWKQF